MKGFLLLALLLLFCQCDYLPFKKKKELIPLDTIVDFSSVDAPPTFKSCKDFIVKKEQDSCFSSTIASLFFKELSKESNSNKLIVRSAINELVQVKITIDRNGLFSLKSIQMSKDLKDEIPEIESILLQSVKSLPTTFPALKRGIPVATEYTLPVRIKI